MNVAVKNRSRKTASVSRPSIILYCHLCDFSTALYDVFPQKTLTNCQTLVCMRLLDDKCLVQEMLLAGNGEKVFLAQKPL